MFKFYRMAMQCAFPMAFKILYMGGSCAEGSTRDVGLAIQNSTMGSGQLYTW